jgi:hypothetical protein
MSMLISQIHGESKAQKANAFHAALHRLNLAVLGPAVAMPRYVNATFDVAPENIRVLKFTPTSVEVGMVDTTLRCAYEVSREERWQQLASFLRAQRKNYEAVNTRNPVDHLMSSVDGVVGYVAATLYEMTGEMGTSRSFAVEFRNEMGAILGAPERSDAEFDWYDKRILVNGQERRILREPPRRHCDRRKFLPDPQSSNPNALLEDCIDCPLAASGERVRRIEAAATRPIAIGDQIRPAFEVTDELGAEFREYVSTHLPDVAARFDATFSTRAPSDATLERGVA